MANGVIDERFTCAAEAIASRQDCPRVKFRRDDIGERPVELRKEARDRYGTTAFWLAPPHATHAAMSEPVDDLRTDGDLKAPLWILRRVRRYLDLADMDIRWETLIPARLRENSDRRAEAT